MMLNLKWLPLKKWWINCSAPCVNQLWKRYELYFMTPNCQSVMEKIKSLSHDSNLKYTAYIKHNWLKFYIANLRIEFRPWFSSKKQNTEIETGNLFQCLIWKFFYWQGEASKIKGMKDLTMYTYMSDTRATVVLDNKVSPPFQLPLLFYQCFIRKVKTPL